MRKLLYFAALNTVRKGGIMHEYYQRCLKRGKPRMVALIAVARKLLGIIFALVRDHSEYVSGYVKPQNLTLLVWATRLGRRSPEAPAVARKEAA